MVTKKKVEWERKRKYGMKMRGGEERIIYETERATDWERRGESNRMGERRESNIMGERGEERESNILGGKEERGERE